MRNGLGKRRQDPVAEEGHIFYGEALIVPEPVPDLMPKLNEATKKFTK